MVLVSLTFQLLIGCSIGAGLLIAAVAIYRRITGQYIHEEPTLSSTVEVPVMPANVPSAPNQTADPPVTSRSPYAPPIAPVSSSGRRRKRKFPENPPYKHAFFTLFIAGLACKFIEFIVGKIYQSMFTPPQDDELSASALIAFLILLTLWFFVLTFVIKGALIIRKYSTAFAVTGIFYAMAVPVFLILGAALLVLVSV